MIQAVDDEFDIVDVIKIILRGNRICHFVPARYTAITTIIVDLNFILFALIA